MKSRLESGDSCLRPVIWRSRLINAATIGRPLPTPQTNVLKPKSWLTSSSRYIKFQRTNRLRPVTGQRQRSPPFFHLREIMADDAIIRRRKLPHIDVDDKPYFITGCLHGSIPAAGLKRIYRFRHELDSRPKPPNMPPAKWQTTKNKLVFKLVDQLLDGDCPITHLSDPQLARIVANAFLYFADQRYKLLAFVIMPSHHHWLFLPDANWSEQLAIRESDKPHPRTPREAISHSIQSYTSHECNEALKKSGTFWQGETYDHYVRDDEELLRIIDYIELTPVKAGLVDASESWQFSSASIRSKLGIPAGHAIPKMEL